MHTRVSVIVALVAATAFGGHHAIAANFCAAENLTCATTMPVGGYCECTSRGATKDGTVVSRPPARRSVNSTAGGCGANPGSPGCR